MDTMTTVLLGLSIVMLITIGLALWQRNERRDVALMAVITGMLVTATVASGIN